MEGRTNTLIVEPRQDLMDIACTGFCAFKSTILYETESGDALETSITETRIIFINVTVIPLDSGCFLNKYGFVEALAGSAPGGGELDTYPGITGRIKRAVDGTTRVEEGLKEHVVWEGRHLWWKACHF